MVANRTFPKKTAAYNKCGECSGICPVDYCKAALSSEYDDERCLVCGQCIINCPMDIRAYMDDTGRFFEDLASAQIVLLLDPSTVSVFPDIQKLIGFFIAQGVKAVFDISFGAELTAQSIIKYGAKHNPRLLINSACPALVSYCEVYRPELLAYLAPVQNPLFHTALMIREYFSEYVDCVLAALSPCAAMKRDFDPDIIEYNITLACLKQYLDSHNIVIEQYESRNFTGPNAERGVACSIPGGLTRILQRELPAFKQTVTVHGTEVYHYLDSLPAMLKADSAPLFVDCLQCSSGCVTGYGTSNCAVPAAQIQETKNSVLHREQEHISKYLNTIEIDIENYWKEGLYERQFADKSHLFHAGQNIGAAVSDNEKLEDGISLIQRTENENLESDSAGIDIPKNESAEGNLPLIEVSENDISEIVSPVKGICYRAALARFGDEAIYISIIKTYISHTKLLLEKIKKISRNNIDAYIITVHGLKSSSRAIGADTLGTLAEELEHAARNQLIGFCRAGNILFRDETVRLLNDLTIFVESHHEIASRPEKAEPDLLLLEQLKAACENYNITAIDDVMMELESFSYQKDNDRIVKIREYLDNSDFASIVALLSKAFSKTAML